MTVNGKKYCMVFGKRMLKLVILAHCFARMVKFHTSSKQLTYGQNISHARSDDPFSTLDLTYFWIKQIKDTVLDLHIHTSSRFYLPKLSDLIRKLVHLSDISGKYTIADPIKNRICIFLDLAPGSIFRKTSTILPIG